ncbi:hypothetical protein ACWA1C_13530 [Flectobacillus roseus]
MKQTILILLTSTLLLSCGQGKSNRSDSLDTTVKQTVNTPTATTEVSTLTVQENNLQYSNDVSTLGIGLIIPPSQFDVFNDSLLTDKLTSKDMYSEDGSNSTISSLFYKPDYGIMHFICVAQTAKAYKVLVNNSQLKYLPKINSYEFKTWDQYILESFGIRRLTSYTDEPTPKLLLRQDPNDNAKTLTIPNELEMFCPIEVKGDWVKVKYDCFYNEDNNPHEGMPCQTYIDKCKNPLTGWLKWRQDNKLLIDIFLMP